MTYIPHTDTNRREMLEAIGVKSMEDLFPDVPAQHKFPKLELPAALGAFAALATGILIVPNCFRDGVSEVLDFQWDIVQRQDVGIGLVEPSSAQVQYLFRHLPGVITVEPFRQAFVRISHGHQRRQLAIQGLPSSGLHNRVLDSNLHRIELPPSGLVLSSKLAEVLGASVGDDGAHFWLFSYAIL